MNANFDLDKAIRKIPDFPKKGILFYDITGVLVNPEAFHFCIDKMVELFGENPPDAVAAIEARGFLFAAPFAERMKLPIIIVRKKGKLPGKNSFEENFLWNTGKMKYRFMSPTYTRDSEYC